ncbi:MAG: ribosome small subunit-dependent GTPase A [Deltaproteobacteria bacterium]|jgi:ribosome biogenesis GTPase|nr:ribosome small subunit-dependent GTPase A [Deltaproteobacteria bacterium]
MITKQYSDKKYSNNNNQHLLQLGWTSHFQSQLENFCSKEFIPARVVGVRKNQFRISNGKREWLASTTGRLKHHSDCMYPVTGDWVLVTDTVISKVLTRRNALSRGAAGTHGKQNELPQKEQVIAANLDTVFVVCGLDRDFNLRRIERYLTLVYNCGLNPVIILTKADLHQNTAHFVSEVETVAFGIPIHLVSALDRKGLAHLEEYLSPGKTTTMVGSSGAGKSTLVNRLYGKNVQVTGSISSSVGKGKHITTTRDLIMMPQGGMVIDNPGIREIAFWEDDGGIEAAFPEIEHLAGKCRFSDCSHTHEPDCRVLQAVIEGSILQDRMENYRKMKRELAYLSDRQNKSADRVEKERWQEVALKIKAMKKTRRNG